MSFPDLWLLQNASVLYTLFIYICAEEDIIPSIIDERR